MTDGIKYSILSRIYLLYIALIAFSLLIIAQIIHIQFYQGKYWKERAAEFAISSQTIHASQGNIFADDGKQLLATSIPVFELRLKASSSLIKDADFDKYSTALADSLSSLFKDRSPNAYKSLMMKGRLDKKRGRYLLIKKDVVFDQIKRIKKFPKIKSGRNAIALDIIEDDKRVFPYEKMAKRTIGYVGTKEVNKIDTMVNGKLRVKYLN